MRQGPVDSDGDGVLDTADACPGTLRGAPVDQFGCREFDGILEGVQFEPNSDVLLPTSIGILQEVVAKMSVNKTLKLELSAHTDSQGSEQSNLDLSRKRVIAVSRYLIAQGIDRTRLSAKAYGESRPIADNATVEGRAKNRRVEVRTLN